MSGVGAKRLKSKRLGREEKSFELRSLVSLTETNNWQVEKYDQLQR